MKNMWAHKYKNCKECNSTERKHIARGLCELCYQREIEKQQSPERSERGYSSNILSKEFLINSYVNNQKSLSEIAQFAKCSRQFVLKKVKEYNLPVRSKSKARKLALERGKLKFTRLDENGNSKEITLQKNIVNHKFFREWSPQMAYVLGIVCTDGNIRASILKKPNQKDNIRISRLTISQKEPELLEKVLKLMNSKTKLLYRHRKEYWNTISGKTYYFHLNSDELYDSLIDLGLTQNKSLTLKFPEVPEEFVHHFIRGCWDGDGSVFLDKSSNSIFASFVSGSIDFISAILQKLYDAGLPERTLHKNNNSYYFRYTGKQCKLLGNYLYHNSDESMWLNRKYELFNIIM